MLMEQAGKLTLAVALFCLAFLTVLVWEFDYFWWDLEFYHFTQRVENPVVMKVLLGLSWLGAGWTPWILGFVTGIPPFLSKLGLRRWAVVFWVGLGAGAFSMYLLKGLVQRPRPSAPLVTVLLESPGYSYPSGHVIFFLQYFGFLLVLLWSTTDRAGLRVLLVALFGFPVLLIGVSRVFSGAHWASDVLGGYLIGGVLLAAMISFYGVNRDHS